RVDAANLAWCSAWMAADDQYRSGKPTVGRTVEILRLAGPGADAAEYRVFRAFHAVIDAGGYQPGLCDHRPGQGSRRARGALPTRAPECTDPDGYGDRTAVAADPGWGRHYRADLRLARYRVARLGCDRTAGLSRHPRGDDADRRCDHGCECPGRCRLCVGRSPGLD